MIAELLFSTSLPQEIAEKYNFLKQKQFELIGLAFVPCVVQASKAESAQLWQQVQEILWSWNEHLRNLAQLKGQDQDLIRDSISQRFVQGHRESCSIPPAQMQLMEESRREFDLLARQLMAPV